MGIPGLLKALADVQREVHVSELAGLRVGLDAYCFLHRGKFACALQLLSGRSSEAYLGPILDTVRALLEARAKPVLVFDGGRLPAKQLVEESRRESRAAARWQAAAQHLHGAAGISSHTAVAKRLAAGVEVTPEMAAACIRHMQALDVPFVVAPAEADAQLAHLALSRQIDVCASEDADLLAYGCPRVIFGLDSYGRGREIRLDDLPRSRGLAPYRMSAAALPDLCVLCGCDYAPPLRGVGLRTAARLLHRSAGDLPRALVLARRDGIQVPAGYGAQLEQARLVFTSQLVFSAELGRLQHLRPLPEGAQVQPGFLGPPHDDATARGIAFGVLNPVTLEPFQEAAPPLAKPATALEALNDVVSEVSQVLSLPATSIGRAPIDVLDADSDDGVDAGSRVQTPERPRLAIALADGMQSQRKLSASNGAMHQDEGAGPEADAGHRPTAQAGALAALCSTPLAPVSAGGNTPATRRFSSCFGLGLEFDPETPPSANAMRQFRAPRIRAGDFAEAVIVATPATCGSDPSQSLAKRRRLGCRPSLL